MKWKMVFSWHGVKVGMIAQKIEHLTLQGYVDLQGSADFGPTLEYKGQMPKRSVGLYDRRYVSVFGEITIS